VHFAPEVFGGDRVRDLVQEQVHRQGPRQDEGKTAHIHTGQAAAGQIAHIERHADEHRGALKHQEWTRVEWA
jgi:hypothetical protein